MGNRAKSYLAILMGVIIAVVDIIWIYQSSYVTIWVIEGAIILVADLAWIYLDYSLMKGGK
ncbi:MAG: hypothetical protein KGI06_01110 [Candidatus Micrarchaeota archaeon]|nr:hypothetical protein [Candidatus Micrarchaeota archaeon]